MDGWKEDATPMHNPLRCAHMDTCTHSVTRSLTHSAPSPTRTDTLTHTHTHTHTQQSMFTQQGSRRQAETFGVLEAGGEPENVNTRETTLPTPYNCGFHYPYR